MKKSTIIAIVLMVVCICVTFLKPVKAAEVSDYIFLKELTIAHDSDGNNTVLGLSGMERSTDIWTFGFLGGALHVKDNIDTVNLGTSRFTFRHNTRKGLYVDGFAGTLHNASWNTTIGNILLAGSPMLKTYVEFNVERNVIESRKAILNQIMFNSYSVSGDYTFDNDITVIGSITKQDFSDSNMRMIYTAQVIRPIAHGLSLRGKIKRNFSNFNPAEYFTPDRQQENLIGAVYRGLVFNQKYRFAGEAWYGNHTVNIGPGSREFIGKLNLNRWLSKKTKIAGEFTYVNINGDYNYNWQQFKIMLRHQF